MLRCTLRGGPRNGEVIQLPLPMCQARLSVESDVWFKREPSGHVALVRGEGRRESQWLGYTLDLYEKIAPASGGEVQYRFLHSESVMRCTAMTKQGKLCRNDAESPSDVCKTHRKKA